MDTNKKTPGTRCDPSLAAARLVDLLGIDRVIQLLDLLQDVQQDPGWGDIRLVVADRKVVMVKTSKSYR